MVTSPLAFLSALLSDVTRVESVEAVVGWTGVASFLGALAEELEANCKNELRKTK